MDGPYRIALLLVLYAAITVSCENVWGVANVDDDQFCSALCTNKTRPCITDLNCAAGETVADDIRGCGCCPSCVPVTTGTGKDCSNERPCEVGYTCTVNPDGSSQCKKDTKSCRWAKKTPSWTPACDADGTYAAVQCKGEWNTGRCFCFSPDGARIYGLQWWNELSKNMTCACSRRVFELNKNQADVSLHCTEDGSYEELQCNDRLCWCANPQTGAPISRVVPEKMFALLPCYDAEAMGSQYLRQCESVVVAQARITAVLKTHGSAIKPLSMLCDLDGSYGFYQTDQYVAYCSWKDNTRIGSWAVQLAVMAGINCYCARDTKYYEGTGRTALVCAANGNYQAEQFTGSEMYCVDRDGFIIYPSPMPGCPAITS